MQQLKQDNTEPNASKGLKENPEIQSKLITLITYNCALSMQLLRIMVSTKFS